MVVGCPRSAPLEAGFAGLVSSCATFSQTGVFLLGHGRQLASSFHPTIHVRCEPRRLPFLILASRAAFHSWISVISSLSANFFASTSIRIRSTSAVMDFRVAYCLSIASNFAVCKTVFVFAIVVSSCVTLMVKFADVASISTKNSEVKNIFTIVWSLLP